MPENEAGAVIAPEGEVTPETTAEVKETPEEKAERLYKQADVDEIVRKVRRSERRRVERETRVMVENERLRQQLEQASPKPDPDAEPKREDFEDYEKYLRAAARWEAQQATKPKEEKKKDEGVPREKWDARVSETRKQHKDFDDVMEDAGDMHIPRGVAEAIIESDIGPDIAYYLAKHEEELERISNLPKYRQAAEVAKLEEKLAPKPEGEKPNAEAGAKPKAPEPITPLSGKGVSRSDTELRDDLSPEEWRRRREAQLRAKK